MDRAPSTVETLHALELRVLEGPQSGARAPLAIGRGCVLAVGPGGRTDGADIVLREPAAAPTRLRVTADLPNAMLEVEQGQVQLGDQTFSAGQQTLWPQHARLSVGATVVAFGRACVDDWSTPSAAQGERAAAHAGASPAIPLRRRAEVWLAAVGAGVLLACAGALAIAHGAAVPRAAPAIDLAALAGALRASEFGALELTRGSDGRPRVHGRVATQLQRQRLEAWIAARMPALAIDVIVDEAVAYDVTEVFRVNGVAVKARVAGPGRIDAEAAERDRDRLARAEGIVRRDVRGLESLTVRNSAVPLPPPVPPVPDDPGKRIASLVPGETAYLVTADGARYFLGALLPSGHRVTQIANASVTLEQNGQRSTLNF